MTETEYQSVVQNLRDAGCGEELIEQFDDLTAKKDTRGQVKLLKKHRDVLLDRVHVNQKRIDCLDYLLYKIKKSGGK